MYQYIGFRYLHLNEASVFKTVVVVYRGCAWKAVARGERNRISLYFFCDFSHLKFKEPKSFMTDLVVGFERDMMMIVACSSEEKKRRAAMIAWLHAREEGRGLGN
jgi:hypothetical protein